MSAQSAVNYTWRYPLWYSHEGYALKTGQKLIKGQIVQTYADNDGGAWYYDPETGDRKKVKED